VFGVRARSVRREGKLGPGAFLPPGVSVGLLHATGAGPVPAPKGVPPDCARRVLAAALQTQRTPNAQHLHNSSGQTAHTDVQRKPPTAGPGPSWTWRGDAATLAYLARWCFVLDMVWFARLFVYLPWPRRLEPCPTRRPTPTIGAGCAHPTPSVKFRETFAPTGAIRRRFFRPSSIRTPRELYLQNWNEV